MVGVSAGKYREVHDSGPIPCDLGYIMGKGTGHRAFGARWRLEERAKNFGMRIAECGLKKEEKPEFRIQKIKKKRGFLLPTGYWILTTLNTKAGPAFDTLRRAETRPTGF